MNNFNSIHKNFRLNEQSFSSQKELLNYAKELSSSVYIFFTDWFDKSDCIVVNTSGSTGLPKSIELKKEYMINSARATGAYFNLKENTSALLCLSTDFIAGKMMLVRALILGWHIDLVEPNSDPLIGIEKTYDFCAMVPLQLYNSIDRLDRIKKLIVGGGVVSKDLQYKINDLKTEIFATYGMTETITHIAVKRLNTIRHAELGLVSHYNIFPNIKISTDLRGCLVIDAPTISNKQIITNDLAELISETEFNWLGRFDNIINSGGVKLSPEFIEDKLESFFKQRFFVAGIPDATLGEKMILLVEGKEDISIFEDLKKNDKLNKFEIPKQLYFLNKFIETPTKKINRKETVSLIFKN